MGTISELLRWKKSVDLKDEKDNIVKTVWIRIIGDHDLQEAYKLSRLVSADKRKALRNADSPDFRDEILVFEEASEEECIALIKAARGTTWAAQAFSAVVRADEVKLEDVAIDPDAPTLEEQEKLDAENKNIEDAYQTSLNDFSAQKERELDAELSETSIERLRVMAQTEATMLLPLTVFLNELQDQKIWRATYEDKDCKIKGFTDIEEFRNTLKIFKDQLIQEYSTLETGLEQVKN